MAVKKSRIYASLWASCDTLRGGMDASQYKDYVLTLLFIKYVSDKYAGKGPYAAFKIPSGASFADMAALKNDPEIGDRINKHIIQPLVDANDSLARSDFPDFNDPNKLGQGKEMVDRLTNLVRIFESKDLDFSRNRAEDDDILGDAYEYLMRNFATESGKSKGQFYTPAEVSRVIAKVIGIGRRPHTRSTTAYDPTCGSGSLLLKVAAEARGAAGAPEDGGITLEGQEKDVTTAGLARMNMILHNVPDAAIANGNTLAAPAFRDGTGLRTYDYVVANPPFSDKAWSTGLDPAQDAYRRFAWGVPPAKQGDYAYLLHIIRSMNSTGKGACILPHGVLFRGNAEAVIRKALVESGYLKGIIGLPANLFYGTGIPACIIVLDKENAQARKGVFMIDASRGFMKDGSKNRLRERDIHKIVSTFAALEDVPGYARMVPVDEIAAPRNDYNLNLPRYIESGEAEDRQSLHAHMNGGIPVADVDALAAWWGALPGLRAALFEPQGEGTVRLRVPVADVRDAVLGHKEFAAFRERAAAVFAQWRGSALPVLRGFGQGGKPRLLIGPLAEALLDAFRPLPLLDAYAVYQGLMDIWEQTMQDDCFQIAAEGWKAEPQRITAVTKKGKVKDKGWQCELVPKPLVVARYFANEQAKLDKDEAELESAQARLAELEEEHGTGGGALEGLEKAADVRRRLREIACQKAFADEARVLKEWLKLDRQAAALKKAVKEETAALDAAAFENYAELGEDDVKALVIEDKWLAALEKAVHAELDRLTQGLTARLRLLAGRYAAPLPQMEREAEELAARVRGHLHRMGVTWN
ncbi:N-6 DNA methylase [uncultured Desulfovibrio sp.]|uniref:type I restriction-modification system subunit M n=1 Tax=uncultured Desulfovibrio sp. TaxID=167968 RepID=UPI0026392CC9|nr:N-6 DNA methylase [uncultured Desulfovibrio sp.]